jgi:hypothetical protein
MRVCPISDGSSSRMSSALRDAEAAAFQAWWDAHAGIPPDAARADGWTLTDVVAHVAAWQRYATERIAAIVRDGADPGPPEDTDGFNEGARSGSGSWDELRAAAHETHERLLDLVASLPEARLAEDDELIPFVVRVNGSGHYEEHPASDFGQ